MTYNWFEYKDIIIDLYNNNTLKTVMQTMEEDYGFKASTRSYRDKIKEWAAKKQGKNIREPTPNASTPYDYPQTPAYGQECDPALFTGGGTGSACPVNYHDNGGPYVDPRFTYQTNPYHGNWVPSTYDYPAAVHGQPEADYGPGFAPQMPVLPSNDGGSTSANGQESAKRSTKERSKRNRR
ncbi:hypothetical protein AAL_03501 [Moelleriella libera RCEF 2490]|uniref:Clr5 domain-containing protein n=1 Tax=Moelleriella libera RCEF 2490 TaxID=1081109 RepID=A0A168DAJ8_9HYPO|nr:hypothetical protein AAL_03501 [Moelleriella libera RCEF 2490]